MATPDELFQRIQQQWLGQLTALTGEELTEDVIIELPFAPPGRPKRLVGRDEFLAFANPRRAALPVRFDECRTLAVHHTTDPDTIIVEYQLTGTVLTTDRSATDRSATDRSATAAFVGVLTARDGKLAGWREYQDVLAIQRAFA